VHEVWAFAEIVAYLRVSHRRVAVLVNRPDFPAPVATLCAGRIWLAHDVRAWERDRRRGDRAP
jgi:prophage regulatory protein